MPAGRVFAKADTAKPPCLLRITGVIEIDGIYGVFLKRRGKVHEDSPQFARIFQFGRAEQDFVYIEIGEQVELDSRIIPQHLETDRIFSADELLLRINANIQLVGEQVVVGPPVTIRASQDVSPRRRRRRLLWRRLGRRQDAQRQQGQAEMKKEF